MEATAVISRQYEPRVAKRIYVFMNGQDNERPRMLVINERHIKDFNTLLNRVTSGIRAPIAVRNLYTPSKGSKVNKLDSIENGKHYVAGGNEHFKKLRYSRYSQLHSRLQPHSKDTSKASPARPAVQVVSRFLNLPEKPYFIHVFRNGDISYQGVRVLLSRRIMGSLEHVLELITEKVELTLPAKRLCTLDGQTIHSAADIKDGEQYVAVQGSKRFMKLPYTAINPTIKSIRNARPKRLSIADGNALGNNTFTLQPTIPEKPMQIKRLMPPKQHKGKDRPFAGRKDMEARNIALRDARADSAFGENMILKSKHPIIPKQSTPVHDDSIEEPPPPLPPVPPSPSPSPAKQKEEEKEQQKEESVPSTRQESKPESPQLPPPPQSKEGKKEQDNEEIPETEDIIIEKPIDQEEAAEVTEEATAEGEETKDPPSSTPIPLQRQDTTAIELQGAATQQSVDLSVARVSGPGTKENTPRASATNLTETDENAETSS